MAASTSNFIFVGVNVASCKNDRELKSLLMREHYRKKREIAASSLGSGINQTSSQRSQRRKHVPFARFPNHAIKQYRKLAPCSATRRLLPSMTALSTHGPTPNKPRSDSPPFHEPQKSPSLAGNRVADVLLPSSDRHIRRQLHEALWHCATITRPVFVDPISDMTASLAVESRRHFRHYFLMPNAWLNLPPDSLTCKTYNIPLAMRFPILIHGFTAFSSGIGGTSTTDKAVSVRHHSELVKRVNEEMAKPYPDYDTTLLGIQGVMASAFVRGDENEFAIHRRGQASFFRSCGIPQDPDVMLHVVSNSLMYGSPIVDCLINDPGAAGSDIEVTNLLRMSVDLEKMVLSIFDQSTSFKTVTAPERAVLGTQSSLYTILHGPFTSDYHTTPHRIRQIEYAHFPFLVVYLHLLRMDLEAVPSNHREDIYSSISSGLQQARISRSSPSATVNWMLLVKFKSNVERTWLAFLYTQVILRLPHGHASRLLRFLVSTLGPEEEDHPTFRRGDISQLSKEVMAGV